MGARLRVQHFLLRDHGGWKVLSLNPLLSIPQKPRTDPNILVGIDDIRQLNPAVRRLLEMWQHPMLN